MYAIGRLADEPRAGPTDYDADGRSGAFVAAGAPDGEQPEPDAVT